LILLGVCALVLSAAIAAQTPASPPPPPTQPAQSRFPAGPGRDALFKVCNDCHGPESVLGHLKTREEWSKTLDEMAANGAAGTDEEWNQILEYLATHYSLIAVNKANAKELAATLDVPPAVAEKIVQARTEKGRLTSIDELKQAAGADAAAKIDARKDRLVF
jgi:competence protein ComEA